MFGKSHLVLSDDVVFDVSNTVVLIPAVELPPIIPASWLDQITEQYAETASIEITTLDLGAS